MNDLIRQIRDSLPEETQEWDDDESLEEVCGKADEALAKAVAEKCAELAGKYDEKAAIEIRLRFGVGK